jgi:glycosyltransferase involved in cell wall biosynthesis
MMSTLSVVIPAYNEEDSIEAIVERMLALREPLAVVGMDLELIVVDDGSCDRTAEITRRYDGLTLVCHERNAGYGAALKTGFALAHGQWLGFLDADGTYPPECFPDLCREALAGADLIIGSRRSGTESEMPLARRVGNLLWSNLVTLLGNHRVIDPASGMRVFRREVLERLYPLPDGLNFTPVMSTRAIHEGLKMVEVPIPYRERFGRSKLSIVRDGTHFLNSIIWTALNYNPVRPLGLLGLAAMGIAGAIGLGLVAARLSGITQIGPLGAYALFAALVLAVAGISIFSLGATFNYLVSLFHRRPVRQGLFGRPIFDPSLDHHFGWLGLISLACGLTIGAASLVFGLRGWPVSRLWLYFLGSAMLTLMGVQLVISWLQMRVLEELSWRDTLAQNDLGGQK